MCCNKKVYIFILSLGLILGVAPSASAVTYTFTTIDVPGADRTEAYGINNSGQIVGFFFDATGIHGFLKDGNSFTTINLPDVPIGGFTEAFGINGLGQIVGSNGVDGFLIDGSDVIIIAVPDQTSFSYASGINDTGQIVGTFAGAYATHGFLKNGDTFTTIDGPNSSYTEATGINNLGQIVGNFIDESGYHTFLKDGDVLTLVDVPGSTVTGVHGINLTEQIVGTFRDTNDVAHGFVRDGTTFTLVDVPNAIAPNFTQAKGINDLGQIVGWFEDASGRHGFLATPISTTLLSPNGGEIIPAGSRYTVRWCAPEEAVKFKLTYSLDNGVTWIPILKTADFITGTSYDWKVAIPSGNKKKCFLKVVGYNASGVEVGSDKSDAPFTIEVVKLTYPNLKESFVSGSKITITWTINATKKIVAKTILFFTKDGGVTWTLIKSVKGDPNPRSFEWRVPTIKRVKPNCKIKVMLKDANGNNLGSDISDAYFTISPPQHRLEKRD